MDLARTNKSLVGFTEEEWEPDTVQEGTCVGVVYRGEDCVAFAYNRNLEILELEVDETSLTFVEEGT